MLFKCAQFVLSLIMLSNTKSKNSFQLILLCHWESLKHVSSTTCFGVYEFDLKFFSITISKSQSFYLLWSVCYTIKEYICVNKYQNLIKSGLEMEIKARVARVASQRRLLTNEYQLEVFKFVSSIIFTNEVKSNRKK